MPAQTSHNLVCIRLQVAILDPCYTTAAQARPLSRRAAHIRRVGRAVQGPSTFLPAVPNVLPAKMATTVLYT